MKAPVIALLGPTNTGKTHHALERLLEHRSGMIGFPLRLLARENYDRVVSRVGPEAVALVTGEERIVPPRARYFLCTVEAMPASRPVAFLAVDEVQLCADPERGHVFTDRLLHARGREETLFLGADTARPLLRRLVPEAAFIARPRLSTLRYAEPKKLDRLPRRSAIVVFSVAEVYAVAERLRRQGGGAAVVFGALSPRTRNAQVALYQAGEVDHLVATDAIGMGLNLDIDHVTFTGLTKYDGRAPRPLTPAEVAQIAGRAGRHVRDGTFGATSELGPFPPDLVEAIESHRFRPIERFYWREADLDFASLHALAASLARPPRSDALVRPGPADDQRALETLTSDREVRSLAQREEHVRLLWDVCQVPDFRNVLTDAHTWLLGRIFHHLRGPAARLPEDWVASQVQALDRTDGNTDALLMRLAAIRTWTYLAHRDGWVADAAHWQEQARLVEDRLSDALHERLTEQFVDRRGAIVSREEPDALVTSVGESGDVVVQGLRVGRLEGFRFVPDAEVRDGSRAVLAAANRALRGDREGLVAAFVASPDGDFTLRAEGRIAWRGADVARLGPGDAVLSPRVDPVPSDLLDPPRRERVRRRVADWVEGHLARVLGPLVTLAQASGSSPAARAVQFALTEGLGCVPRRQVAPLVRQLGPADRRWLARHGVRTGRVSVFVQDLASREATALRALLFAVRRGAVAWVPTGPSVPTDPRVSPQACAAAGFVVLGPRALRADLAERLAQHAFERAREGRLEADGSIASLASCPIEEAAGLLTALGYAPNAQGRFVWGRGVRAGDRAKAGATQERA
jgi:ATP-dependent RNA helicase SUPV3L1/SUV3